MANNYIDLFSYLPGIETTQNDLLEAEVLVYQILNAKFPTIDLREGTGIRDMVIRPAATLLAMMNKALLLYFSNNTLSSVDNTTPTDFVDKLMSNWFLTRNTGSQAVISARLFFSKSKSVSLTTDISFSPDSNLLYYPVSSATYPATMLTLDVGSGQYYIDVQLVAAQSGTAYNIGSGSLIYFTNFDPYFMHAEINYLVTTATDPETNKEFIARGKSAISTRNLINVPSVTSNLLQNFNYIDSVLPIGFGDHQMIRDLIQVTIPGVATPVWIHNGGKADVYCDVPLVTGISQFTTDATGKIQITGANYLVTRSSITGGTLNDTVPLTMVTSVSSLTNTGLLAQATTSTNHGYYTGQQVTIAGATPTVYNGTYSITVTGPTTFTYTLASLPGGATTGTITATINTPFTVTSTSLISVTPSSITGVGTTATVTYPNHGLSTGERVWVNGAVQPEYNGTFVVTSIVDQNTFTYTLPVSATASPATGSVTFQYPYRSSEVGFSTKQTLVVDFGVANANKTASFNLYTFSNIDSIQAYLSLPANRVICGDYLARGFNLTMLNVSIVGYNGPAPDSATAATIINTYLKSLVPGQSFIMADLLSQLYAGGISTIQTPLTVTYTKYWKDLLPATTGTIVDVMNPGDALNLFVLNNLTTSATTV